MKKIILTSYFLVAFIPFILGQVGQLDSSFGNDGVVITPFGVGHNYVLWVDVYPDDSFILAGHSQTASGDRQFAIAKYSPDGELDQAFGAGGLLLDDLSSGSDGIDGTALLPDGSILVAGYMVQENQDIVLARYTYNGQPDESFGIQGKVTFDGGYGNDFGYEVEVHNERIFIGAGMTASDSVMGMAVVRTQMDGTLDPDYGSGGYAFVPSPAGDAKITEMNVCGDGSAYLLGYLQTNDTLPGDTQDILLVKLSPDGVLDTSFGTNGMLVTSTYDLRDLPYSFVIQPDNKIVVVGSAFSNIQNYIISLIRVNANGSLDSSFGDNGIVTTMLEENALCLAEPSLIQPDGKMIIGGYISTTTNPYFDIFVVRYDQDGSVDSTFGTNGWTSTDLGENTNSYAFAMAFQSNFDILLGSSTKILGTENHYNFAVARYIGDHTLAVYDNSSDNPVSVQAFPNPCTDHAWLQFELDSPDLIDIALYDLQGRLLRNIARHEQYRAGMSTKKIDVEDLRSGVYILKVSGKHIQQSTRIILSED